MRFFLSLFLLLATFKAHASAEVVVTIKPLHSLVQAVMEEAGEATLLFEGETSPHDVQLKPSQIRIIQNAKIIFSIDERFETIVLPVVQTAANKPLHISIAALANLTTLPLRRGGEWALSDGAHDHAHHHHGAASSAVDFHLWLDPDNAIVMVDAIVDNLASIYPEHRAIYQANADLLIQKLQQLDDQLSQQLLSLSDYPFIVFHDAYQYFEQAYDLHGVGAITLEPHESSSPKRIRDMRHVLRKTGAKCVFSEPQFSSRIMDVVTEGMEIKHVTIDPLGSQIEAGKDAYITLMYQMGDAMETCLERE